MLSYLTEASHIVAGMGISFDEALEIVIASHSMPDEPVPPMSNVVYDVPWGQSKLKDRGTL